MLAYVQAEVRGWHLQSFFFFFLEIVSYWAWNSDIWLDWLAGESQCSGSLCPQSHYTRIFTRVLRVHTQVLPLLQQALQWLSHLSSGVFCVSSPWSQQISTPKFKGEKSLLFKNINSVGIKGKNYIYYFVGFLRGVQRHKMHLKIWG